MKNCGYTDPPTTTTATTTPACTNGVITVSDDCRYWLSRLVGLVVEASASRAEDPGFESRFRRDFSGSSHSSDLTVNVLYHTVSHKLHGTEWHNWKQHFCLTTFFENLQSVVHASSTN